MVFDEGKNYVPLVMAGKVIGLIHFDPVTGDITGRLTDKQFADLLNKTFGEKLAEVAFFGQPALPREDIEKRMGEFEKWKASR